MPAILTYHSQNIAGWETHNNDHVALAHDLEALTAAGVEIWPLARLLDWLERGDPEPGPHPVICLTLDDGCDFDARDLDWPGVGRQRSMLGILGDFIDRHGSRAQPGLHATSFVIASPEARLVIDRKSLFGKGWMSEDWWREVAESGLLAIGNHGWDHNHPDLEDGREGRGGFAAVDSFEGCSEQVVDAAQYIESLTGAWPEVFAYPFGEASEYIRAVFFPGFGSLHRCRAALGTEPGQVDADANRWWLPRYVCGRDWSDPAQLLSLLDNG